MNEVQISIRPPSKRKKPSKAKKQEGKVRKRIEEILEARALEREFEL